MKTRPFLSHKRQDRRAVIALKRELCLSGTGGWRDLDDLVPGEVTLPGFDKAINETTGGFIWYGTNRAAGSSYINTVELPRATARKRREPTYPLVPVFLAPPSAVMPVVESELSLADYETFRDCNGEVRGRSKSAEFHRHVAQRYARAALDGLDQDRFTVAATAMSEPDGSHDFTLDWRTVVPERTRVLADGMEERLRASLANLREGFQPKAAFPEITLDINLPLPLAMLIGYEWRVTTHLRLVARQRVGSSRIVVRGRGRTATSFPDWTEHSVGRQGPTVFAVATTNVSLDQALDTYAHQHQAGRTLALHLPSVLDADGIRGLAQHVAEKIRAVGHDGFPRHLLIAGPVSLALFIGAAWNANGPVIVPLWNGSGYGSAITIG
jgi:SMODS-associated and fused to various effectors sensor domain